MAAGQRISISFSDKDIAALVRFKKDARISVAETVRRIVHDYISEHPDRFRLPTQFEDLVVAERIERTRLKATDK